MVSSACLKLLVKTCAHLVAYIFHIYPPESIPKDKICPVWLCGHGKKCNRGLPYRQAQPLLQVMEYRSAIYSNLESQQISPSFRCYK